MSITVIKNAEITFQEIYWNVVVEYNDKEYIIMAQESDNGGDYSVYEYDTTQRHNLGAEVEDLYDEIIETLQDSGEFGTHMTEGLVVEL